jgi:hypothetical protein
MSETSKADAIRASLPVHSALRKFEDELWKFLKEDHLDELLFHT